MKEQVSVEIIIKAKGRDNILRGIHATKGYERRLFGAVKSRFNENLSRWVSEIRPDHCGSNCFIPDDHLTTEDVQAAVDANMARGLDYAMFSMNRPMDTLCMERYDFDTDIRLYTSSSSKRMLINIAI